MYAHDHSNDFPKISSVRRVNLVSSQININVITSNSVATQIQNVHINIGNVNSDFKYLPSLPLIKLIVVKKKSYMSY